MIEVRLQIGETYIEAVLKKMNKHKISQNALAREMGREPSQVSRWFTKNPNRHVKPTMETAVEIEKALEKLIRRKARL